MGYVLTNGKYYIRISPTGATEKTLDIREARIYLTTDKAKERLQKALGKTRGYYILDMETDSKYQFSHGRIKFPRETRELIYRSADGRCALCGRKLQIDDMTLDHITPLSMGGNDTLDNIQCACKACNQFKSNILPDDFMNRITEIFMYQTRKRLGDGVKWRLLQTLIK
jgi:Restriction endonuclease